MSYQIYETRNYLHFDVSGKFVETNNTQMTDNDKLKKKDCINTQIMNKRDKMLSLSSILQSKDVLHCSYVCTAGLYKHQRNDFVTDKYFLRIPLQIILP